MKWLFIVFLILNICYFGWESDRQTRIEISNSVRPFNIPDDAKKLELLKEFIVNSGSTKSTSLLEMNVGEILGEGENGHSNAEYSPLHGISSIMNQENSMIQKKLIDELTTGFSETETNDIYTPDTEKALCISFGPFAEQKQADELSDWLHEKEIQNKQKRKEPDKYFWIYLPASESKSEATTAIENLKSKGVQDYKIISEGNLQNAISLGLFSTQSAANKRLNELENIGYQPIIVPRYKSQSIIWVDAKFENRVDAEHVNQREFFSEFINGYPSRFNSIPVQCEELFKLL